jgi:hypothetical protein
MKNQGYLAFLFASLAACTIASTDVVTNENMTAPATASTLVSRGSAQQQHQQLELLTNQQLTEIAAAAAASRGVTLPVQKVFLRHRRTTTLQKQDQVENLEDLYEETEEVQKERALRFDHVLDGKLEKFLDKTLDAIDDHPPLLDQFSMPLLGMGPFGLGLGRPRGGRSRKNGGGSDNQRRDVELQGMVLKQRGAEEA